jgi:hypothetical protein
MTRIMAAMFTVLVATGCDSAPTDQTASSSAEAPGPLAALAGSWQLYPAQSTSYATSVQQPINTDGSSNFKANSKAVIPVKFALSAGTGLAVFQSIGGDGGTDNDYSYLSFTPSATLRFSEINTLSAVYAFTQGDCHGGSLRWQVRTETGTLFIYYGVPSEFGNGGVNGCTGANGGDDQSGENLLELDDLRYDTSQYSGGTFYDTQAHALALMGTQPVTRVSLILDSGWQGAPNGDQILTLTGHDQDYEVRRHPQRGSERAPLNPAE